jgi:hypothetical protein
MDRFLGPVREGARVLMALNDPGRALDRLFDGYVQLLEVPRFVAVRKSIHFMPDWWAILDLNFEGAPGIWGRDVDSVRTNLARWNAGFAVVYQSGGTELDPTWRAAGFDVLSQFSWRDYEPDLGRFRPAAGDLPEWWLLHLVKPQARD